MNHLVALAGVMLIAATGFLGCSKKGGFAASPGASPGTVTIQPARCNPGQVYNTTYGCLDRASCPDSQGWVPTLQRCEAGTPVTYDQVYGAPANLRWGYSLLSINRSVFEQLMRDYGGFCDQYTWNWGASDCGTYSKAGFIIVQATGASATELNITIGAGASSPYSQYDYWSAYMGLNSGYYPMQFRAKVYPINNSQGIEFRADGLAGTRSWNAIHDQSVRGIVDTGKLTDNVLRVQLYYKGNKFADAPVERY